ncbi:solute carrier family 66 member 2 isoform X1 [Schistocerca gregaria]|uniref:solute carrier family 66 member 2 isoform X1 n=1 Tax=Schistocerca gregaria TaxID=7010 RepID=UPI00211E564C|nr:solute carrier family 66 member 2 isoform X1 [Schistocerca gregaria]
MDTVVDELYLSLSNVVKWIAIGAIVFGGIVPYIPQYKEIKRTEDTEGFSLFVCLTLLIANTLRIFFWFGKQYELPLLIQSIIMNITMLAMVHLCVNIRNKNQIIRNKDKVFSEVSSKDDTSGRSHKSNKQRFPVHTFRDFDLQYFWAWTDFISYIDFLIVFHIACGIVMYLFIDVPLFVELVGFLAVLFEAMLGVPQLKKNYQNKSTLGMSVKMVLMWTTGDIFKTIYFLVRQAPPQFWICGVLQILIDIGILSQVYLYRNSSGVRAKKQDMPD